MNQIIHLVFCGLLIGLVLFGGGCGQLVTGSGSKGEHEEGHLEHFVPAHRPGNFTEAVNQIASRVQRMNDELPAGKNPEEEAFQELLDIVGWLPEIAADSEMRRKNWEQVDSLSDQMMQAAIDWQAEDFPASSPALETMESCIEKLQPLRGTETVAE